MTLRRILPLAAATLLAAGCNTDDITRPESEAAGKMGVQMGGSGGYTAPSAPRMNGSQMGGSGGYTPVETTTTRINTTSTVEPTDPSDVTGRGVNMIGGG